MKRFACLLVLAALVWLPKGASADTANINCHFSDWVPCGASNPSGTLTLPNTTTAYTAGQLIANNATAGSVVTPSIYLPGGGAYFTRVRLSSNDATANSWDNKQVRVDLWSAQPTWTNGDRGTWSPATGAGSHLGSFTCTMSATYGDGSYAECAPDVGNVAVPTLGANRLIYWSLDAVSGSGTTGASKTFTLTLEQTN